ncbi:MAG TPA: hypothetical protein DEP71_02340 [Porphyromonadaceae bacterium]|nr:hypothetical protein [Porphyromonadaceae bacterium]
MKRIPVFTVLLALCILTLSAQDNASKKSYTFLLTGASFASPNNGWFEIGCELSDANPLNRAIGGEAIADAANRIIDGTLYTIEELEHIDALVIMQEIGRAHV